MDGTQSYIKPGDYKVKSYSLYSSLTSLGKEIHCWDFPGGPVVKNLPSNGGDKGSIPGWWTKVPHASGQLSLCTQLCNEDPVQSKQKQKQKNPKNQKPTVTANLPILSQTLLFFFFSFLCIHSMQKFPDQISKLCSLLWKHGVLTPGPPGKSLISLFHQGKN